MLVATQEVTEMKNGKRSTVKRKFFPSYILVEMIMNKETQHFINSIPGVTRFIGGTPLKPSPSPGKRSTASSVASPPRTRSGKRWRSPTRWATASRSWTVPSPSGSA